MEREREEGRERGRLRTQKQKGALLPRQETITVTKSWLDKLKEIHCKSDEDSHELYN